MVNKSPRDLNAPDLVKKFKQIVNENVMMGRDAAFLKDLLEKASPVQILYGMYQFQKTSITVPQFVKKIFTWYEDDELQADIELARYISHHTPPEYYTYMDLLEEETAFANQHVIEARKVLREWSERVLA